MISGDLIPKIFMFYYLCCCSINDIMVSFIICECGLAAFVWKFPRDVADDVEENCCCSELFSPQIWLICLLREREGFDVDEEDSGVEAAAAAAAIFWSRLLTVFLGAVFWPNAELTAAAAIAAGLKWLVANDDDEDDESRLGRLVVGCCIGLFVVLLFIKFLYFSISRLAVLLFGCCWAFCCGCDGCGVAVCCWLDEESK